MEGQVCIIIYHCSVLQTPNDMYSSRERERDRETERQKEKERQNEKRQVVIYWKASYVL